MINSRPFFVYKKMAIHDDLNAGVSVRLGID